LADEREFDGVGQSELMRGACWIAPIAEFQRAGSPKGDKP
jgi:hypothetical protein